MNDKIRLAVIGGYPPNIQGEANYNGLVFDEFHRLYPSVDITIFAHKIEKLSIYTKPNQNKNLKISRITGKGSRFKRSFDVLILFLRVLHFRPNIIHFQGVHTPLYGGFWGEPILIILFYFKFFSKVKQFYTLHSTWKKNDLDSLFKEKNIQKPLKFLLVHYYQFYLKSVIFSATKFRILTAGYKYDESELFIKSWNLNKNKIDFELHPCSQPIESISIINKECKNSLGYSDKTVILCSGFLRRDKNLHKLISSVASLLEKHSDILLMISGKALREEDEIYYNELLALVSELNIESNVIINNNFLSDDLLDTFFNAADIVAIPYGRVIGASGPIHHAMSRGKYIVASNIGHNVGLKGIIDLFDSNSIESLTQALQNAIIKSKNGLNQESLKYAKDHTWSDLANEYFNIYVDNYE
jgi:glycosyltransferase involved in cell wall biosynthesis